MPFRLRPGTADDLGALVALDVLCFEEVFRFSRAAMRRFTSGPNKITTVAETEAGELLGFAIVTHHPGHGVAYLVTLDVAPLARRQGVGSALLRSVEQTAAAEELATVELHVHVGNPAAHALYERMGYQSVGAIANYYGEQLDATELIKPIRPGSL